jgi:hypothetical protein
MPLPDSREFCQSTSDMRLYIHGTLLFSLKTEKKLRPRQQPLAIRKAVKAAINPSCDRGDIVLIRTRIQTPGLPVPTRDIDRQVRVVGHLLPPLMGQQVPADGLAVLVIVGATGELDQTTALEARSIIRLGVPKIATTFISTTVGDFYRITQLTAFMADLCQKMRLLQWRCDAALLHLRR